ncbi:MAG: hypothetical protein Q4G22_11600 [Paracoccus sp. (in: a-proteobacteria)]|uniref:hypothetical protein n=1 Tax=Paracoccus sp. TaxID=267 RepID=UPI0026E0D1CF|nr:hypothetical protein [Paracoccus sp. (in: a-proteobacteria)]MDO5632466.1 hypothetical protein [Paracoccus sp. (in: a-proteobacteria)]
MLIFWNPRLAFLATPKAGSSAVEAALEPLACAAMMRPPQLKHTDLSRWRSHVGPWLSETAGAPFTTVALMREPVDWLRSWYRFRLRDDLDDPSHAMQGVSFAAFARAYGDQSSVVRQMTGTQSAFLIDGAARPDRIFRYEDMPAFIAYLEDMLDCVIELPRVNVPPSVDVELTPTEEDTLRAAMAQDLRLYDSL